MTRTMRKRSLEPESQDAPSKKLKFLDDEDSDTGAGEIKINKEFAARFEHNNKRSEMQRLQEKYGKGFKPDAESESDSESEQEEDDEGEFATVDVDEEISATIKAIRSKDPRLYDKNAKFFREFVPTSGGQNGVAKEKGMTLKDYHRKTLLDQADGNGDTVDAPRTYLQDQADAKNEFLSAVNGAADEMEGNDHSEDEFLVAKEKVVKPKTAALPDVSLADKDPENFLSNFLAARAWVPTADSKFAHLESDDSEEEDRAEQFEAKYNLRFEDPDLTNKILFGHSRKAVAEFSVRREKPNARQKARDKEREQKEAEKAEREAEKARLRKLKIEQMEGKLKKIRAAAGYKDINIAEWTSVLDDDWDDTQFDREMQRRFGEEYYREHDDVSDSDSASEGSDEADTKGALRRQKTQKPVWDDDIDIKDIIPDFKDEDDRFSLSSEEDVGEITEDETKISDIIEPAPATTKSLKASRAAQKASSRRDRRIIESLVDQNLTLAASLPAKKAGPRFAYRETSPSNYGLSTLDILAADDAQLNQWAGIKKYATWRDGERKAKDRKRLGKKARLREWRKETFGTKEGPELKDWYIEEAAGHADGGKNSELTGNEINGKPGNIIGDVGEKKKKRKRSKKKATAEGIEI